MEGPGLRRSYLLRALVEQTGHTYGVTESLDIAGAIERSLLRSDGINGHRVLSRGHSYEGRINGHRVLSRGHSYEGRINGHRVLSRGHSLRSDGITGHRVLSRGHS
jgi:hypothetical protein